jgi:hypothetical protein
VARSTIDWINKGPVSRYWDRLRPLPWINLEPLYENILEDETEEQVRNAIWWSLLSAPVAGVTYGANGIWSWLEEDGQKIQNHRQAPWTLSWRHSLDLPVGRQMSHVRDFFRDLPWWDLFPVPAMLTDQPGDVQYDRFVAVASTGDARLLVAYVPRGSTLHLRNTMHRRYRGQWYDPAQGIYLDIAGHMEESRIELSHDADCGLVLLLQSK